MAGYIGKSQGVTQVDGYNRSEADAEFVNDPDDVITVSSGNVGIGTSSPAVGLEVSGSMAVSDTTTSAKRLQLDSGANSHTINSANYGSDMMDLNIQAENLIFNTGLIGVAERMRIDSAGRVTMPYQPSAFAWHTAGTSVSANTITKVSLDQVGFNQGISFDGTNSRFTVPVTGKYFVSAAVTFNQGEGTHAGIYINGGVSGGSGLPNNWLQAADFGTNPTTQQFAINTRVLYLAANDYVELFCYQTSGGAKILQNGGRNFLSIHLLG